MGSSGSQKAKRTHSTRLQSLGRNPGEIFQCSKAVYTAMKENPDIKALGCRPQDGKDRETPATGAREACRFRVQCERTWEYGIHPGEEIPWQTGFHPWKR